MRVRLWLKTRKASELANRVSEIMNPSSANYHHWLSKSEDTEAFKPSSEDAEQLRQYLSANGATEIAVEGHAVSANLSVAQAQTLFGVKIHKFKLAGQTVIANTSDPKLSSEIASQVAYVGGLTTHRMKPMLARQRDLNGGFIDAQPFTAGVQFGAHESNCFRPVETHSFATTGTTAVEATYTGNRYGSDANATAPHLPPCGYSPADVQKAYGVDQLIQAGLDGKGQTIVIIDAYGSPTIAADAQAFSAANGLPAPELTVIATGGPTVTGTLDRGPARLGGRKPRSTSSGPTSWLPERRLFWLKRLGERRRSRGRHGLCRPEQSGQRHLE